MKLYTLEYDCNLPTTQQVNIATNTDAKIGIKVRKDGEYVSLDGSTLSVVTPNATISADAEPTNGYVTFPIATTDSSIFEGLKVKVNKEHTFSGTIQKSGQWPNPLDPTLIEPSVIQINAKTIDCVGAVVSADVIGPMPIKQWRSSSEVPSETSAWTDTTWLTNLGPGMGWLPSIVIIEGYIDNTGMVVGKEIYCKTKTGDDTKFVFCEKVPGSSNKYINERDTYTLTENTTFVRKLTSKAGQYYGQAITLDLVGAPTKATFNLNVNVFKSQQGDINGGGDVPADVATQTWVNSQISDFITDDALTAYATKAELTSYAETDDLTAYYTKSETSSATELADAFANVGGGAAISAYALSDSPIQSETLIRQALVDNTCLPQTIALNQDGTIEIFDVEGTLNLHQESPSFISLIPNAVKVLVGTKVTNLAGRCFWGANKCKDIVLPNSLSGITAGSSTGEVFTSVPAKRLAIPDSVTTFGNGNVFWNWQQGEVVDFGNTRLTIPTGGSFGTNSPTVKYIVPDSLYSQWITTGNWANVSAQVFPHSQMPGAVKGSAYAGTIGTPATISNMQTVYETDWATISASAISSTFYVVVPDPE